MQLVSHLPVSTISWSEDGKFVSKFLIASDYDYCKYLQVVAGLPTPTAAM